MNTAKILIIEDDTPIADLLSYGLSMEGFQTKTASSGVTYHFSSVNKVYAIYNYIT